jgi:hypothetical protein
VKFIDEPLYRLIDVIFICSNVSIYLIDLWSLNESESGFVSKTIFYHFKSSDYHEDKLVETDRHDRLRETVMKYDGIGFSKYLPSDRNRILVCLNDFKNNHHELTLYERSNFRCVASKRFDSVVTLSLANADEIVCYVPHEYLVFNHKLEQIDSIQKKMPIELGGRFAILSDSSRYFYYFKLFDEISDRFLIKVSNPKISFISF